MKTLESIKSALKSTGKTYKFNQLDDCINTGLAQLWSNENVVKAIIYSNGDDCSYILFITDQRRIVPCYESKETVKGMIFDHIRYSHSAFAVDMTGVDANKIRCVERSTGGFFSSVKYDVIFEGQAKPFKLTCDEKETAFAIRDAVIKYVTKPAPSPAQTTAANDSTMSGSAIAEIRKMYEDGIIDKDEMIELIKSLK